MRSQGWLKVIPPGMALEWAPPTLNKTSSSPGYITKAFSHKCCLSAPSCFFFLPDFFESSLPRPDCRVPANSISHFVSPPLSYINYTRSGKTACAHSRFGSAYHKDSNHNIVE